MTAMIVTLRFAVIASSHSFRPKSEAPNEIRRIARPCAVLAFRKVTIMAVMTLRKPLSVLVPQRVRQVPASFAWIDHRLRSEGFLERLEPADMGAFPNGVTSRYV